MIDLRRQIIINQPHQQTAAGTLVTIQTDLSAPLEITGSGNITVCGKNLFNREAVTHGKYINSSGGISNTPSGYDWCTTDYIPVLPGNVITYTGFTTVGASPQSAWYKADKTLLSVFKQVYCAEQAIFITPPANAYFVRFSIQFPGTNNPNIWDPSIFAVMQGEQAVDHTPFNGSTLPAGTARDSLTGINNIWSDAGSVSVTYWTH